MITQVEKLIFETLIISKPTLEITEIMEISRYIGVGFSICD
jgi:hypothetical protein